MPDRSSARITKPQFLHALVCPTMAYFDRQQPRGSLDAGTRWLLHVGNRVGELAREALGPGRMLPPPFSASALADSAAAIAARTEMLFEATVEADGLVARADALVPHPVGGWELIEVKSGKMPDDGKLDAEYLDDIAYTLLVAQRAGVRVTRATMMLLSREYTLGGEAPLFGHLDVTDAAHQRAAAMQAEVQRIGALLTGDSTPPSSLRLACKKCDYFATFCIGRDVDDSVLRIPRINEKKLAALAPHERIGTLPASVTFTDTQQQAVDVIRTRSVWRDDAVLGELRAIQWPASYLDFETVMPALPWFPGDATYSTMPNQFSIHSCSEPNVVKHHIEYLAPIDADWRRELAEELIRALEGDGSILVYSSYEKTQLKAMAQRFPDLDVSIQQIIGRLVDLERFFKQGYIHHRFAGSSSIKKVLPVLVPDLSYDAMPVGNGSDAAGLFSLMREGQVDPSEHATWRAELLAYCKLDTLAMVRLHAALVAL